LFFVQDEASQICAAELAARPGERVIDVCAAPGGKSFFAAMDMENEGELICLELHEGRLAAMQKGAERLGIACVGAVVHDSRRASAELIGTADRVLADVPCTGFGAIRRKPEIKYKPVSGLEGLLATQYAILAAAAEYVKPGGTLIYSTCTLNKDENEAVVTRFLSENRGFSYDAFVLFNSEQKGTQTFFPFERKFDGFFVAKMKRL
jgi:16S rRNA (cytosine967-C5)-methyltransferase